MMNGLSRRGFIKRSAAVAGALTLPSFFPIVARAGDAAYRTLTTATPPFVPIKALDTSAMPWSPPITS